MLAAFILFIRKNTKGDAHMKMPITRMIAVWSLLPLAAFAGDAPVATMTDVLVTAPSDSAHVAVS